MVISGQFFFPFFFSASCVGPSKNSAPEHAMDKIQNPADKAKTIKLSLITFFDSLLLPNYKQKCPYQNTKPQVCYCPDGLMVKLSVSRALPICTRRFESCFGHYFFFSPTFFYCKLIHVFNNLGYAVELMKGLEEAHV